jgi:CubicO group peptidase (beta-lactamase class C family)
MLGRSLDFEPGQRYAYSNFGYCILGRIIEKISRQPYGRFVQESILKPLGIQRMQLGASLEENRAEREVKYYMEERGKTDSVFPEHPEKVPAPYGSFCLEAMDSHGGWLASVVDLAKFAAGLERCGAPGAVLTDGTRKLLYEAPAAPVSRNSSGSLAPFYYGCGWLVRPAGKAGANYWHNGSLPGTFTLLVRRFDGLSWVALFNKRSADAKLPDGAIDPALHRAADAVSAWPAHDLFPAYAA